MSVLRRLLADRSGASAAELALLAPILSLAILAGVDLSAAFSQKLTLVSAADRAAGLASAPGIVRSDYTFLKAEAESAAGLEGATATVSNWLECNGTKQAPTVKLCGGSTPFARYVGIDITAPYKPFFNYGGLINANGMKTEGSAKVRIQ